ncbi:helix-turn-helix domain-containing protein [Rhizobium tumorigenes]|uniref:helix-turn-helix domain-containing protein n=1 Tax=Rhizobium tumorigenes TaxID=2041385 RepID=UPI00241CC12B|nr:helix-turn-helix transcriptional regulator [Rhizobium tumorigenes]WFS02194.1 helix-turn-helix transcriptional regulator [Rhizobium tumorigenes]
MPICIVYGCLPWWQMLKFDDIDQMLERAGISASAVCRAADLHPNYLSRLRRGEHKLTGTMRARILLAISRVKRGESNFDSHAPAGAYRLAIAYVAKAMDIRAELVLAADPRKRATADPAWLAAANARRWALYIVNQYLGMSQAQLARAANMSKAAVSIAMNDVEDDRGDPLLERMLSSIEGAFLS